MDLQSLETNVMAVKTEAETLVEAITNPQQKMTLGNFITSITKLSDFLDDAQNVKALNDYDKKRDANKDNCPLDILCIYNGMHFNQYYEKLYKLSQKLEEYLLSYFNVNQNNIRWDWD